MKCFLTTATWFNCCISGHFCFSFSGSSPTTQPSNVALLKAWVVGNFLSHHLHFSEKITSTFTDLIIPLLWSTPYIYTSTSELVSEFISLFSTSYPISPFESLKFNVSKLNIFKFSIYKNQSIDLSPETWFDFCFPYLSEPYRTKSSSSTFLTQHSYPVCHKVLLI